MEPETFTSPALISTAFCPRRTRPAAIRPIAIRPTYSEKSRVVQSIRNGLVGIDHGPRDVLDDHVEERLDVPRGRVRIVRGEARLARGEDVGKIELFLAGALLDERVEDLVEHLVRPRVGAVDLVDHHDRPDVAGERLAEHELRLGHRPFEGVDQHQRPVGHLESPLDLAAEIGVARRVDQVDLDFAVVDRDVLGEDRDPSLSLQVVGVEDALALELRGPELAALAEHRVDQRGLAVVNVGDDGYVANVVASFHRFSDGRGLDEPVGFFHLMTCNKGELHRDSSKSINHIRHPPHGQGRSTRHHA